MQRNRRDLSGSREEAPPAPFLWRKGDQMATAVDNPAAKGNVQQIRGRTQPVLVRRPSRAEALSYRALADEIRRAA